jgi:hypothetical protein
MLWLNKCFGLYATSNIRQILGVDARPGDSPHFFEEIGDASVRSGFSSRTISEGRFACAEYQVEDENPPPLRRDSIGPAGIDESWLLARRQVDRTIGQFVHTS